MIYFIVTTSILNSFDALRRTQYEKGILSLVNILNLYQFNTSEYKIIIAENSGTIGRNYLDDLVDNIRDEFHLDIALFKTKTNLLKISNKGIKELIDVRSCVREFNILNEDFIVKMTGRYVFHDKKSEFINVLKNKLNDFDAIVRYGPYHGPSWKHMGNDCVTGLIGMKCELIKSIAYPKGEDCVEWQYAKTTLSINKSRVHIIDNLGIFIAPGSNEYFLA
jgi:hypothetical protein